MHYFFQFKAVVGFRISKLSVFETERINETEPIDQKLWISNLE